MPQLSNHASHEQRVKASEMCECLIQCLVQQFACQLPHFIVCHFVCFLPFPYSCPPSSQFPWPDIHQHKYPSIQIHGVIVPCSTKLVMSWAAFARNHGKMEEVAWFSSFLSTKSKLFLSSVLRSLWDIETHYTRKRGKLALAQILGDSDPQPQHHRRWGTPPWWCSWGARHSQLICTGQTDQI